MKPHAIVTRRTMTMARMLMAVLIAAPLLVAVAPDARACSLENSFPLTIADLAGGDPADPLAHLESSYQSWLEENLTDEELFTRPKVLPPLLGVWYERTLVAIDPLEEDWIGSGGVTVVDAVWGQPVEDLGPRSWPVDNTSCADVFPLPIPGQFNLVLGDNSVDFDLRNLANPDAAAEARAILTSLWGEPSVPERQPDQEAELFDEVWIGGRLDNLGELGIRSFDANPAFVSPDALAPVLAPTPGTVPDPATEVTQAESGDDTGTDTASEADDGDTDGSGGIGFPWIVVPMVLVALGLGLWFAVRRPKRTFSVRRLKR